MAEFIMPSMAKQESVKTLSKQIARSVWTLLATGVYYCKKAGIVTLNFVGGNPTSLVKNAYTEIGTLPAEFFPVAYSIYGMVMLTSNGNKPALVRIATTGKVSIYHTYDTDLTSIWGSVSFPVNT